MADPKKVEKTKKQKDLEAEVKEQALQAAAEAEQKEVEAPEVVAERSEHTKRKHQGLSPSDMEDVTIICDPAVKINGIKYEGEVTVPRHVAQTIIPMIQAKRRTDMESITGKSYLVQKLVDGTRIVKETALK